MNVVHPFPDRPGALRRYVRVREKGAATLLVGDEAIDVEGFTTGGVVVARAPAGRLDDAVLVFRFAGFEVSRDLVAREVRSFENAADSTTLFELVVEADQQLGGIIVAFLKNSDLRPGDLLKDVAERPGGGAARNAGKPGGGRRRETNRALAGAIMVCAVAACLWTGYQRLFVVDAYGLVTASEVDPIRADAAGIFYAYGAAGNRPMHRDELIGLIDPRKGKAVSITSPCDCFLGDPAVPSGSPVSRGAVVARVIPPDARVEVTSHMPLSELWAVSVGDSVDLYLPDALTPVPGRITRIERDKAAAVLATNDGASAGTLGVVHIAPEVEIGRSLVGSEVPLRIVRASRVVAGLLTQ
jgi:hypothetical protein